jgi:MHS family proline/betaine transporter-like MFS transporter
VSTASPTQSAETPQAGALARRRAVGAAVIGNVLEWYDFAVYAFLATVLARKFFPGGDELSALLATFAVFGVGFVVRPLGGIIIGRLGDRRGRKYALLLTIVLMALGTVMIGVLPSYETIGVGASLLLVVARLLQGFSAGGEWGSSTAFIVEWAPPQRRGLVGSLQQASVAGGFLLGSLTAAALSTALSPAALEDWGWRVPFLLGGMLGPLGLYMRRNIEETPPFKATMQERAQPAAASAPHGWQLAARAFGFTVLWTISYYIFLSYMPTFLQQHAGLDRTHALWSSTLALVVLVAAVPAAGALSDRIGRKPLLLGSCAAFVLLPYPLFALLLSGPSLATVIGVQMLFALAIALFSGPGPAAIAEIFPTRMRSTWMSIGYSVAVALFGGFAPYVATWLIARTGSPLAPTGYVIGAAVISAITIATQRETAHEALR